MNIKKNNKKGKKISTLSALFKRVKKLNFIFSVFVIVTNYITLRQSSIYPEYLILIFSCLKIYLLYKNYYTYVILFVLFIYLVNSIFISKIRNRFTEGFNSYETEIYNKLMSINEDEYDSELISLSNVNFQNDLTNLKNTVKLTDKNENFDTIISNLLDWYDKYESDMKIYNTYDEDNIPESVGELFESNNELHNLLNHYGIFRTELENLPTINTDNE